jgi:hypothetical protein
MIVILSVNARRLLPCIRKYLIAVCILAVLYALFVLYEWLGASRVPIEETMPLIL